MLGSEIALGPNAGESQSKTKPSHVRFTDFRFTDFRFIYWLAFAMSLGAASAQESKESESTTSKLTKQELQFFETRIRPLLATKCYACHSVESGESEGGLRLDSREAMLRGGTSGPAVVPKDPAKSLLIKASCDFFGLRSSTTCAS